jgi:hypothetical protein
MRKFATFVVFLFASLLAAGLFGVVHDQISYTVSAEYFTKFKFIQFHLLDLGVPERIRAAKVGFLASWWMGVPLGLLTGVAGFIHPSTSQMRRALLLSLPVIMSFTLAFALLGLVYGFRQTVNLDLGNYAGWFVPQDLKQPRNFICVGYMHNSAYIGGVVAIPVAWIFHFLYRRHTARGQLNK